MKFKTLYDLSPTYFYLFFDYLLFSPVIPLLTYPPAKTPIFPWRSPSHTLYMTLIICLF